jgi:hypothetical protein
MVFGALAVTDDPAQIAAQLWGEFVGRVLGSAHPLGGVEPRLDALGELHLFLRVEQSDLADLLEIRPDRVGRGGEFSVLAGLAQRLGLFFVPDEVLRAGAAGRLRLLGVDGDLLNLDLHVGQVFGSGVALDIDLRVGPRIETAVAAGIPFWGGPGFGPGFGRSGGLGARLGSLAGRCSLAGC